MKKFMEPSELLLESDIISLEEKQQIIAEIDRSFLVKEHIISDLGQVSAKSNGLKIPLFVFMSAIIITLIILVISTNFIVGSKESESIPSYLENSEWGILKIYMQESKRKLESKDSEINIYREEIVYYDQRLSTLRKLLNIKKITEDNLAAKRIMLETEGIPEQEIVLQLVAYENSLISDIAPEMAELYGLSIQSINDQIDKVLNDKTKSEERLQTSIAQRENLISENMKLEEELNKKQSEIPEASQMIEAMESMNQIAVLNEKNNIFTEVITGKYNEIFKNLDEQKYDAAIASIQELQDTLLADSDSRGDLIFSQLPMQNKIAALLKEYAENMINEGNLPVPENSEYEKKIEKIAIVTDKAQKDYSKGNSELAKSELETVISSIPEISIAFTILRKIIEEEVLNRYLSSNELDINEPDSSINQTDSNFNVEGTSQDVEDININPEKLLLLGEITSLQFDQISLKPIDGINVVSGTKFFIVKSEDEHADLVLGTGIILNSSPTHILGKLESLFISTSKPEVDDLIYIKPQVKN